MSWFPAEHRPVAYISVLIFKEKACAMLSPRFIDNWSIALATAFRTEFFMAAVRDKSDTVLCLAATPA